MILTSTGLTDNAGNALIGSASSQINATVITFTGEVANSSAASGTLLSSSFTKIKGAETNIIVFARINGNGRYSGVCGSYIAINGVNNYTYNYVYDNWSSGDQNMHGIDLWTGIPAGTIPVSVGWTTNDGGGSNMPWSYTNPSGGRTDSRHRAMNSYIAIFEVKA